MSHWNDPRGVGLLDVLPVPANTARARFGARKGESLVVMRERTFEAVLEMLDDLVYHWGKLLTEDYLQCDRSGADYIVEEETGLTSGDMEEANVYGED
jgi:hypothetical protein